MDMRMVLDLQLVHRRIAGQDADGLFPKLLSVFYAYERWFLVEELVDGRNCKELLEETPFWFRPLPRLRALARAMLRTLAVLHAAQVMHCDVHPGNILLTAEQQYRLVDFGCSRLDQVDPLWAAKERGAGHVGHQSIEMLTGEAVGTKHDLWSLGITLCELACGRNLWRSPKDQFPELISQMQGLEPETQQWVVGRGYENPMFRDFFTPQGRAVRRVSETTLEVLEPVGCLEDLLGLGAEGASLLDLIRQLMRPDQRLRPSAAELLAHTFLQETEL